MFRHFDSLPHRFLTINLQIIPLVYSLNTTLIFRSSNAAGLFFELNLTFGAEGFLPYVFIFGFCRLKGVVIIGDMDLFLINDNLECWRLISCAVAKIFHLLKNFF